MKKTTTLLKQGEKLAKLQGALMEAWFVFLSEQDEPTASSVVILTEIKRFRMFLDEIEGVVKKNVTLQE
jgi:hypothetical protein